MRADKDKITKLLKTARGQLDGILKMVEDDRYCMDISQQLMAVEAILNKAGKLTEEEYEIIKGQVEASIGIIRHLPSLDYVIPAVIGHHERYDGRGYPRRTVGENIPLSARILCIADSFDAMTTKRSYKDVIPKERALQILEEEAGKQFDPKLVPVFVCGMQEGRIQMANEAGERK